MAITERSAVRRAVSLVSPSPFSLIHWNNSHDALIYIKKKKEICSSIDSGKIGSNREKEMRGLHDPATNVNPAEKHGE